MSEVVDTPRIKQLTKDVACKIAAGEVIERPASVLKELLENSIDAKATKIEVQITQGGLKSISVIDNGCGIVCEDLQLALLQHATSKISSAEDLAMIYSLGFRGEALASINSIAKVTITSQTIDQAHAWRIDADQIKAAAHPIGTKISVDDLFYNVPARRKFLRSEKTEYIYLEEVFRRVALSHFNISFKLIHNDKLIKNLPRCIDENAMMQRMLRVCGKQTMQNALKIDAEQNGLRLGGWIGKLDSAKSNEVHQYFFINKRMIKDRLINHAIREAYEPATVAGKMPFYCLYLELDPEVLDVNVHPTKHEVRFRDARIIHAFIVDILRQALQQQPQPQMNNVFYHHNDLKKDIDHDATGDLQPEVLCILDQKVVLAQRGTELLLLDLAKAKQQLVLHGLQQNVAAKLAVPVTINLQTPIDVAADFVTWCLQLEIELDALGPLQIVIRSLPKVLLDKQLNFTSLIDSLFTLWSKQASRDSCHLAIAACVKHSNNVSLLEATNIVKEIARINANNIYKVLTATHLQKIIDE